MVLIGDNMLELLSLCWFKQLHVLSAEISDKFVNYKTCTFLLEKDAYCNIMNFILFSLVRSLFMCCSISRNTLSGIRTPCGPRRMLPNLDVSSCHSSWLIWRSIRIGGNLRSRLCRPVDFNLKVVD